MIREWYLACFKEIENLYSTEVKHDHKCRWMRLQKFSLPNYYNLSCTKLLITLGGLSNFDNPAEFSFYITKGLWRTDGIDMSHYHESDNYNRFSEEGYARLSLHIKSFNPSLDFYSGDRLVDIIQATYNFLAQRD